MSFESSVANDIDNRWSASRSLGADPLSNIDYKSKHLLAKRCVDVFISASTLLLLLPFLFLVVAAIKMDSKGPILFSQRRWGKDGRVILVYKFRSMRTDLCDETGVKQTTKGDQRVTRVGAMLRRSNIDELPQLWNVLVGDMSLVGPRCHPIGMLAAGVPYETLVPNYHDRHVMRPGLTGLAQVRGLRGPTDRRSKARARIACDLHYVENFTVWLDFKILVATAWSEFRGGTGF